LTHHTPPPHTTPYAHTTALHPPLPHAPPQFLPYTRWPLFTHALLLPQLHTGGWNNHTFGLFLPAAAGDCWTPERRGLVAITGCSYCRALHCGPAWTPLPVRRTFPRPVPADQTHGDAGTVAYSFTAPDIYPPRACVTTPPAQRPFPGLPTPRRRRCSPGVVIPELLTLHIATLPHCRALLNRCHIWDYTPGSPLRSPKRTRHSTITALILRVHTFCLPRDLQHRNVPAVRSSFTTGILRALATYSTRTYHPPPYRTTTLPFPPTWRFPCHLPDLRAMPTHLHLTSAHTPFLRLPSRNHLRCCHTTRRLPFPTLFTRHGTTA